MNDDWDRASLCREAWEAVGIPCEPRDDHWYDIDENMVSDMRALVAAHASAGQLDLHSDKEFSDALTGILTTSTAGVPHLAGFAAEPQRYYLGWAVLVARLVSGLASRRAA